MIEIKKNVQRLSEAKKLKKNFFCSKKIIKNNGKFWDVIKMKFNPFFQVEEATLLCRLCILQARHTNQTVVAGIPVPPEKPYKGSSGSSSEHRDKDRRDKDRDRSSSHRHKESKSAQKRRHEESSSSASNSASKQANNENGGVSSNGFPPFGERDHGDNIVKQQKMEDEIRRLKSVIIEKDTTIFEKDKQVIIRAEKISEISVIFELSVYFLLFCSLASWCICFLHFYIFTLQNSQVTEN